jgi:digeranylgeranylglycerophospholipid reductase
MRRDAYPAVSALPYVLSMHCVYWARSRSRLFMKTDERFDVIVVGAGPAGAMAAQYAAKSGLRIGLLERKGKAGIPVRCGEAVGLKGLSVSLDIEQKWILASIKKIRMVSPAGIQVDLVNPAKIGKNYVINREVMDNDLVQKAIQSGAVYIPSTAILSVKPDNGGLYACISSRREFRAPCIILADGVESRLARDLGWNTPLSLDDIESCAFCRVEHDAVGSDTIEFHVGNEVAPGGFAWVFPRGG